MQKKCVIGSSLLHGSLIAILFLGAAFSSQQPPQPKIVELVNLNLPVTDAPSSGPSPQAAAPVQPVVPKPPSVEPVKPIQQDPPQVVPVSLPVVKPQLEEIRKEPPIEVTAKAPDSFTMPVKEPKPPKQRIKVDISKPIDLTNGKKIRDALRKKAEQDAEIEADHKAAAARENLQKTFRNTAQGLATKVSLSAAPSATVVDIGQGNGQAFANYKAYVFSAYYAAWIPSEDVLNDKSTVEATIVILRDGSISSATISKKSDQPAFNSSVERALRNVKSLPPFPESTKDLQRTFRINFIPNNKQSLG